MWIIFLLISFTFCAQQFVHSTEIQYVNYTVENAVAFDGNNATMTSQLCDFNSFEQILECPPGSKLDDGVIGGSIGSHLVPDNIAYEEFFAFGGIISRQQPSPTVDSTSAGIIQFNFRDYYSDSLNIVLHFINNPSQGIGLPTLSIETLDSKVLYYTFDDNFDLQPNDATIRNVSLKVMIPAGVSINGLVMEVLFTSSDIVNWFLLSEVDIFDLDFILFQQNDEFTSRVLGPDGLESSTRFICTVINSGSYDWSWERDGEPLNDDDRHVFWVAAATRSGQLEINQLRYSDSGNYTCIVRSRFGASNPHMRTFQLTLKAELKVSSILSFAPQTTASVACELYGYLPGEIVWRRNGEVLQPEGIYSFTRSTGNIDSISVNGVPVKSHILTLNIANFSELNTGNYSCVLQPIDSVPIDPNVLNVQKIVTLSLGDPISIDRTCVEYPHTLNILVGVNIGCALLQIIINILHDECRNRNWRKWMAMLKSNNKQAAATGGAAAGGRKKHKLTRSDAIENNDIGRNRPPLQRVNTFDEEQAIGMGGNHVGFVDGDDIGGLATMAAMGGGAVLAGGMAAAAMADSSDDEDIQEVHRQQQHEETITDGIHLAIPMMVKQESDDTVSEDHSLLPQPRRSPPQSGSGGGGIGQKLKPSWFKKKNKIPPAIQEIEDTMEGYTSALTTRLPFLDTTHDTANDSSIVPSSLPFSDELNKMVDKAKDLAPKLPQGIGGMLSGSNDQQSQSLGDSSETPVSSSILPSSLPFSEELHRMVDKAKDLAPKFPHGILPGTNDESQSLEDSSEAPNSTILPSLLPFSDELNKMVDKAKDLAPKLPQGIGGMLPGSNDQSQSLEDSSETPNSSIVPSSLPFSDELNKMVDKAKGLAPKLPQGIGDSQQHSLSPSSILGAGGDEPNKGILSEMKQFADAPSTITDKLNPTWLNEKIDQMGHKASDMIHKAPSMLPFNRDGHEDNDDTGMDDVPMVNKMIDKAKGFMPAKLTAPLSDIFDRGSTQDLTEKVQKTAGSPATEALSSIGMNKLMDSVTDSSGVALPTDGGDSGGLAHAIGQKLNPAWLKDKADHLGHELKEKLDTVKDIVPQQFLPPSASTAFNTADNRGADDIVDEIGPGKLPSTLPLGNGLNKMVDKVKEMAPKLPVPASGVFDSLRGSKTNLTEMAEKATDKVQSLVSGVTAPIQDMQDHVQSSLPTDDISGLRSPSFAPTWLKNKIGDIGQEVTEMVENEVKGIQPLQADDKNPLDGTEEKQFDNVMSSILPSSLGNRVGNVVDKAKEIVPKLDEVSEQLPSSLGKSGTVDTEQLLQPITSTISDKASQSVSNDPLEPEPITPPAIDTAPADSNSFIIDDQQDSPDHDSIPLQDIGDEDNKTSDENEQLEDNKGETRVEDHQQFGEEESNQPSEDNVVQGVNPSPASSSLSIPSISITTVDDEADDEVPHAKQRRRPPLKSLKVTESARKPKLNKMMKSFHLEEEDLETVQKRTGEIST